MQWSKSGCTFSIIFFFMLFSPSLNFLANTSQTIAMNYDMQTLNFMLVRNDVEFASVCLHIYLFVITKWLTTCITLWPANGKYQLHMNGLVRKRCFTLTRDLHRLLVLIGRTHSFHVFLFQFERVAGLNAITGNFTVERMPQRKRKFQQTATATPIWTSINKRMRFRRASQYAICFAYSANANE